MIAMPSTAAARLPLGCATCPVPAAPETPQIPVPVPVTPPPNWARTVLAAAVGPRGAAALVVDNTIGEPDGYATWVDAVAAARALSSTLGRAVAVLDHGGRLYLGTLHVPAGFPWLGMGQPYSVGALGERAIDFARGAAMRGIVQNDVVLTRGDCLVPRVLVR